MIKKKSKTNLKRDLIKIINQFEIDYKTVLIKPNFNTADSFPASTDKEFLKTIVEIIEERGAKKIYIGESSTFYKNSEKVIRRKNLAVLNSKDIVEVVNFDNLERVKKVIPNGKYLKTASVPRLVDEVDTLLYLPCMKTHFHAQYTGSIKLSVGLLPSFEKISFHIRNLQRKIVEVNKLISPDLIIMDGRRCFVEGGPVSGRVEEPQLFLASTDRVAIDLEAIKTIQKYPQNSLSGLVPKEITQIKFGIEQGIGTDEYKTVNLK